MKTESAVGDRRKYALQLLAIVDDINLPVATQALLRGVAAEFACAAAPIADLRDVVTKTAHRLVNRPALGPDEEKPTPTGLEQTAAKRLWEWTEAVADVVDPAQKDW